MAVEHRSQRSKWHQRARKVNRFAKAIVANKNALVGGIIIFLAVFASVFGPMLTTHDPTATNPSDKFAKPVFIDSDSGYVLGADNFGRDLLSRVLMGGRTSLFLGVASSLLGLLLGVPVGLSAGYLGGKIDEIIMRLMDTLMSFPSLLLALLILTTLSSSIWNAILAVGFASFPRIARVVRGSTISVKNEEYIKAAEARGESKLSIMFDEILPNIASPIVVEGTIRIGFGMLVGSALSFLGLGTQPPNPDWGYMIAQARVYVYDSPWFLIWPAIALAVTVMGFNLFGDGLRDILDPQTNDSE